MRRVPALPIPGFIETQLWVERGQGGFYDPDNGGQWQPGPSETIPFRGAFLPVKESDMRLAQARGWDVSIEKKVYSNKMVLREGEHVIDGYGNRYLITNALDHDYAGIVKIYFCRRAGEAGQ